MLKIKKCPPSLYEYYSIMFQLSRVKSNCSVDGGHIYKGYSIHNHPDTSMPSVNMKETDDINGVVGGRFSTDDYSNIDPIDIIYTIDENSKVPY